jgi:hypothetical protein
MAKLTQKKAPREAPFFEAALPSIFRNIEMVAQLSAVLFGCRCFGRAVYSKSAIGTEC